MTGDEVLTPEVVAPFDKARAVEVLGRLEAAMSTFVRSTVQLADMAYEARTAECWRVDGAFLDARAGGTVVPPSGDSGSWARVWLGWKFGRDGRGVERLAIFGHTRAIIRVDPTLPELDVPEYLARPLGKLLHPRYLASETPDDEAHEEAVRQAYRDALAYTQSGTPAEAIKMMDKALKKSDFRPLRRVLSKSENQKGEARRAGIHRERTRMTGAGYNLLQLGAFTVFDEAMAELVKARERAGR